METNQKIYKICVCSPHFSSLAYYHRLRGIQKYLDTLEIETDLQIRIINSRKQLQRFIESLRSNDLDGVIFISLALSDNLVYEVKDAGVQCVLIENSTNACTCVINDNFEGGRIAAKYFVDHGYDNFAVLTEPFHWDYSVYTIQDRVLGFQAELGAAGFTVSREHIYENKIDKALVREQFSSIFPGKNYPKAFFVTADMMAVGLIQAARDCGVRVPEDVAIIGFDDIDPAEAYDLTTISQHLDESGRIAAEALIRKLTDPDYVEKTIEIPLSLIERKTV